jgi:hypothetical protein
VGRFTIHNKFDGIEIFFPILNSTFYIDLDHMPQALGVRPGDVRYMLAPPGSAPACYWPTCIPPGVTTLVPRFNSPRDQALGWKSPAVGLQLKN